MKNLAKEGTKFFVGHNADNSTSGRKDVGEIVSSFLKEINGKLHNIVVGHFPEESEVKDLDIISMEANIDTDMYNNVNDVMGISGIAMDSSITNSPAFPGARLMSAIQCFEDPDKNKTNLEKETKVATFEEVKAWVREHNVHPSQLYTEKQIQNDRDFSHVFDENSKLKADNELLTKSNNTLKEQSETLVTEKAKGETKTFLTDMMKEGYTDKQKEFITQKFGSAELKTNDEAGVKNFLDNAKKEYADFAKLFGGSDDNSEGSGDDEESRRQNNDDKDPVELAMAELEK